MTFHKYACQQYNFECAQVASFWIHQQSASGYLAQPWYLTLQATVVPFKSSTITLEPRTQFLPIQTISSFRCMYESGNAPKVRAAFSRFHIFKAWFKRPKFFMCVCMNSIIFDREYVKIHTVFHHSVFFYTPLGT